MPTYLVTYDLRKHHKDYSGLIKAIKAFGDWAKVLESVWMVRTNQNAKQVRDYLKAFIDSDDGLFVLLADTEAAWTNCNGTEVDNWIKAALTTRRAA